MSSEPTAVRGLRNAFKIFLKDLQSLPDEAFDKSFGPKTRTVEDIVYEVNLVNHDIGMVIRGEAPPPWPDGGWIKAPADFKGKAVVLSAFEESSESILSTVSTYSADQLEEKIKTEDGETTRSERCRFMTLHLWYHSGQLNFIQTLLGDDEWHWNS